MPICETGCDCVPCLEAEHARAQRLLDAVMARLAEIVRRKQADVRARARLLAAMQASDAARVLNNLDG